MSRRGPVTEAQWLMSRKVHDGIEPPAKSRIAAMLGVHKSVVSARATAEGWQQREFFSEEVRAAYHHAAELAGGIRAAEEGHAGPENTDDQSDDQIAPEASPPDAQVPDETSPAFLANASAFVSRQLARLIARADRNGGRLDKAQIDGLVSLSRMAERWEAGAMERAKQEIKKSDDELAAILKRVNDRIIQLARELAARMVAEKLRSGGSETEGRLVQ